MRKSKNRYFYHIFVSAGDAPGVITLNVVWMEREFDAYKLTNCLAAYAHLSITVSEIEQDICEIKSSFYHTTLHSTPLLGGFPSEYRYPVWYGKNGMVWQSDGVKISKICLFVLTWSTNVTDRRTDRQTLHDSKDRAYASHRAVKMAVILHDGDV